MSMTVGNRSKPLNGNGAWANYVANKRERQNFTLRINCEGECYYFKGGLILSENEFNEMFPIGLINRSNHERLDSRQNIF
jgi:hypothetical protein